MKKILNLKMAPVILILFINSISAQKVTDTTLNRPINNIFLNLLGEVTLFSIDYDKIIPISKNLLISTKLGIGYNRYAGECPLPSSGTCPRYFVMPHHFTVNFGRKQRFFELGLGGTILIGELLWQGRPKHYFLYPIIGYRVQPLKAKKINFRFYTNLFFPVEEINLFPFGLSLGLSF